MLGKKLEILNALKTKLKRDKELNGKGNKVFVNEVLTQSSFRLRMKAKSLRKEGKLVAAWSRGDRVWIKKEEGVPAPALLVTSIEDLDYKIEKTPGRNLRSTCSPLVEASISN